MRSLKEHSRELLRTSAVPPRCVAEAIGCSITWVTMFESGHIKSPNVDLVQKLYEYLTGTPLLKD